MACYQRHQHAPQNPKREARYFCEGPSRRVGTTAGLRASTVGVRRQWGERRSGGATFVVVMQTADVCDWDNRATGWRLGRPTDGSILIQREVSAPLVIVGEVALQVAAQRALVPHDEVIEALAPEGSERVQRTDFARDNEGPSARLRRPSAARYAEDLIRKSRHDPG
jgi:hypothetical protein